MNRSPVSLPATSLLQSKWALPITLSLSLMGACTPSAEDSAVGDAPNAATEDPSDDRVLVSGAAMRGANGIYFGPQGNLWVASVVTPGLIAFDPQSGEVVERLGPEDHATAPDDLVFGADGSIYWTNISFGTIGKRAPDGSTSVIADLGPGVNPITMSDDGRLFVSQCFMDTGLFEIDPNGVEPPRSIRDDLGPNCGLNGMDWGADGKLYGPRWFRGEVVRIDVDSGEMETVADGFQVPAAVKFAPDGTLHVLDSLAGQVLRLTEDGSREVVAQLTPGLDNLAFDDSGRLFVSSFADGALWEALGGEELRIISPPGLNMPGGLDVFGDRLVVADFFAMRTLDRNSGDLLDIERDVIGFSQLGSSMSVRWLSEPANRVVQTSWFDNLVRIWDVDRKELIASTALPLPIDALGTSANTVAASSWLGEDGAGSVVEIDFSDNTAPSTRVLAAGLQGPAGLALHGSDLLVAERSSGRVLRLAADGSEPTVAAEALAGPEGLAILGDRLWVVEADADQVRQIDLTSGESAVVAGDLDLHVPSQGAFPGTMLFNGIAAVTEPDETITLYVSGDESNVLYRLKTD